MPPEDQTGQTPTVPQPTAVPPTAQPPQPSAPPPPTAQPWTPGLQTPPPAASPAPAQPPVPPSPAPQAATVEQLLAAKGISLDEKFTAENAIDELISIANEYDRIQSQQPSATPAPAAPAPDNGDQFPWESCQMDADDLAKCQMTESGYYKPRYQHDAPAAERLNRALQARAVNVTRLASEFPDLVDRRLTPQLQKQQEKIAALEERLQTMQAKSDVDAFLAARQHRIFQTDAQGQRVQTPEALAAQRAVEYAQKMGQSDPKLLTGIFDAVLGPEQQAATPPAAGQTPVQAPQPTAEQLAEMKRQGFLRDAVAAQRPTERVIPSPAPSAQQTEYRSAREIAQEVLREAGDIP